MIFYDGGGLTTLDRPVYEYGLPLVLGACEVRLTELTNLYAALACNGSYRKAITLIGTKLDSEVQLFSPEATHLLTNILIDLKRPDLPGSWQASVGNFPVAWKTGTSYGRRDAWAVGYTPQYTVGVWAGNCSGEGSIDLVGAKIAAPIMFDIFSQIVTAPNSIEFPMSPRLAERQICAVSGQPVGRFCDKYNTELFIPGRSPSATCSVHRPIFVDKTTGLRLRASCTSNDQHRRQVVEIWPPRLSSWLVNNGLKKPLPPYDPECLIAAGGLKPSIISPESGSTFELVSELPAEYQKIRLQASIASGDGQIHWFIDGLHLKATNAGEVTFYTPVRGKHTILCVDDNGLSASSSFVVN